MPGAVDSLTDNRHNYARYTGCTTRSRTVGAQNIPKEHVTTAGSYQHNSHLHAVRMATERSRVMSSAAQCVAVFFISCLKMSMQYTQQVFRQAACILPSPRPR